MEEKIAEFLRTRGPATPIEVARGLRIDSMVASALLAELYNHKKLHQSRKRIGTSRVYFLPSQFQQARMKILSMLDPGEQEAVRQLRQKGVIMPGEFPPAVIEEFSDFLVATTRNGKSAWEWFEDSKGVPQSSLQGKAVEGMAGKSGGLKLPEQKAGGRMAEQALNGAVGRTEPPQRGGLVDELKRLQAQKGAGGMAQAFKQEAQREDDWEAEPQRWRDADAPTAQQPKKGTQGAQAKPQYPTEPDGVRGERALQRLERWKAEAITKATQTFQPAQKFPAKTPLQMAQPVPFEKIPGLLKAEGALGSGSVQPQKGAPELKLKAAQPQQAPPEPKPKIVPQQKPTPELSKVIKAEPKTEAAYANSVADWIMGAGGEVKSVEPDGRNQWVLSALLPTPLGKQEYQVIVVNEKKKKIGVTNISKAFNKAIREKVPVILVSSCGFAKSAEDFWKKEYRGMITLVDGRDLKT